MKITTKQLQYLVENEVRKQLNNNKINEGIFDTDTTFAEDFMNILEPYRQEYLQYKWELDTDSAKGDTFMKYILGCTKGHYSHKYNMNIYKIQQCLDVEDTDEIWCTVRLRNTMENIDYLDHIAHKYHLVIEDMVKERYLEDNDNQKISDKFVLLYSYFIPINKVLEILPKLLSELDTDNLTYLDEN